VTRALLVLLLILGQFPLAAAPRRRAAQHPPPYVPPAALVTAAHQAADVALKDGAPAVQIAVSHHGRVVYSEAFGMTDKESATVATPRSVLRVASITKQFTSAAILRLAERGALKLDDRIETFVPEFDTRGATITLRHLLTHTSGLPTEWYAPTPPFPPIDAVITRQQAIETLNARQLTLTPGAQWNYSNLGYRLLAYAIESITGKPYADFIHQEFVLPLGLMDTGVCGTSNLPLPEGYVPKAVGVGKVPATHTSAMLGSGGLCSTASDLARWAHLLANGQAILPGSYATMTTPAVLNNKNVTSYGLGIDVQKRLAQPAVSHGGQIAGFDSFLVYFPDKNIAVAVIVNLFPGSSFAPPPHSEVIGLAVAKAALGAL
jgi:D-alanyl-D-alanine carboxypeptidase